MLIEPYRYKLNCQVPQPIKIPIFDKSSFTQSQQHFLHLSESRQYQVTVNSYQKSNQNYLSFISVPKHLPSSQNFRLKITQPLAFIQNDNIFVQQIDI